MSEGLNRVILLGNLGADPELRVTQNGNAVLNLRLATTERYVDKAGEKQERTEWHNVTMWGKRAEGLAPYLNKGSRILVEGSLRTSSYEDKEGNKRYKTEVNATNVVFAGGGSSEQGDEPRQQRSKPQSRKAPEPDDDFLPDDDIPF